MCVILIFVDGLGVGKQDSSINPCLTDITGLLTNTSSSRARVLPFDGRFVPLDASLGVSGLPQSATGQTALLTGVNAAQLVGRHLNGFPNETLRRILRQASILKLAREQGYSSAFLNAFRPLFFSLDKQTQWHLSATTVANLAAGLPFFTLEDVAAGRAIYQDFTNRDLLERGFEVPIYAPEEAADILVSAASHYDFLLYEYFKTDHAGHSQDMELCREEINKLARFLYQILSQIDLQQCTLILTSDHGNIEDISLKTHTYNPVMTIVWGAYRDEISQQLHTIMNVTPAILQTLAKA